MKTKKYPNTRLGWHKYYVNRFNKSGSWYAEWLALSYLMHYLAFGEASTMEPEPCTNPPSSPAAADSAGVVKHLSLASA
jgi:hypothetical protein